MGIIHSVPSGRDVILEGKIYTPSGGFVELPKEVNNQHISPHVPEKSENDDREIICNKCNKPIEQCDCDNPPVIIIEYENADNGTEAGNTGNPDKDNARADWILKNGTARGFEANWKKEHKDIEG